METTYGFYEIDANGMKQFHPGTTAQGLVFKDLEAFNDPQRRDDICYISESGFEGRYPLSEKQARMEISQGGVDTHNSIFAYVKELVTDELGHSVTDKFVENLCEYIIQECDWQCLGTLAYEIDIVEEYNCFGNAKTYSMPMNEFIAMLNLLRGDDSPISEELRFKVRNVYPIIKGLVDDLIKENVLIQE